LITGSIRSQIDAIWDAFWSGGISNPLEVIEQINYLLFLKRLDENQLLEERRATELGQPMRRSYFPEGNDESGQPYSDMRWSHFKNFAPQQMFDVLDNRVFPFLRSVAGDQTSFSRHMEDARFTIPTPNLLSRVVDMLDEVEMDDRDTKGDLYEYMLSKIATAGQNGQFRTPRHIIQLMVELTAPQPGETICDPACGTAGFLVATGEYLRDNHPEVLMSDASRSHFNEKMFHGYDFDNTMLRIGSMNMLLHGVENPAIEYKDSLSEEASGDSELYDLVLANPPFAGSLDYENTAKNLQQVVRPRRQSCCFSLHLYGC